MITVQTHVKSGDAFVLISTFDGDVPDPRYVEGAIELTINGKKLLGLDMWDHVDQLWSYLVDAASSLAAGEEAGTYLPDQPIRVTLTPIGHTPLVGVQVKCGAETFSATAPSNELVNALAEGAQYFFRRMLELFPDNPGYRLALCKAEELLAR